MNLYKEAPTWLYNLDGDSKLFTTQDEVDEAWKGGWFGPPFAKTPLLSQVEMVTKADIFEAVEDDPRYDGLVVNLKKSRAEIMEKLVAFETEHDLAEVIIED